MKKIIVYCEVDFVKKRLQEVSYELISKAFELTKKALEISKEEYFVEAVALCDEIDEESVKKAFLSGAKRFVFVKDKCLSTFSQTVFSQCFVEYFKEQGSDIVIFPATSKGRIVAPRITTLLDTGLVADCTNLDFIIRENKMFFAPTRPTFGSELMATILSKTSPQCATVRPKTFRAEFDKNLDGELVEFKPTSYEENRVKLIKTIFDNSTQEGDFSNTKIVLCAGYGLIDHKDKKYFLRLEEIAKKIGAKVASTRKVVDIGLMPQYTQIGQTGATVEADLYIGFGVSGAIQHVAGMKNCKTIIAVNNDLNAEIFNYADYKIVADAKWVIDQLIEKMS